MYSFFAIVCFLLFSLFDGVSPVFFVVLVACCPGFCVSIVEVEIERAEIEAI